MVAVEMEKGRPNSDFFDTKVAKDISIGQDREAGSVGPYLPLLSGSYNVIAFETSDFESFEVTVSK